METINKTQITRKPIPKQAYDSEYMTEWKREVDFLFAKGINYVYTKKTPDYGITQYKYTKTPELFAALTIFYSIVQAEKLARVNSTEKKSRAPRDNKMPYFAKDQVRTSEASAAISEKEKRPETVLDAETTAEFIKLLNLENQEDKTE